MTRGALHIRDNKIVTVAADASFDLSDSDFSASFFCQLPDIGARTIIQMSNDTVLWQILITSEGKISFKISKSGGSTITITSDDAVNDNTWRNFIVTYDLDDAATGLKLYVDNLAAATPVAAISSTGGFSDLVIGDAAFAGTGHMLTIDDIRIYKGVILTDQQRFDIYKAGKGAKVVESEFAAITSDGFYSNCGCGEGNILTGRKIASGTWSWRNSSAFDTDYIKWVNDGVPFATTGNGMTSDIEQWMADTIADLTYNGNVVFKTSEPWDYQLDSGIESIDRYTPSAFTAYYPFATSREAGDLNDKLRFSVMIGLSSKEAGVARRGDSDHVGASIVRDLVIAAIDNLHPGYGFDCDDLKYSSETIWLDSPKRYVTELHFVCNRLR